MKKADRSSSSYTSTPRIRRGNIRLSRDASYFVHAGHPFVYRDSLGPRTATESSGDIVTLLDEEGRFLAKGIYDAEGGIAIRVVSRDENDPVNANTLLQRIEAAKKLRELFIPSSYTVYRVFHGEGDFFPGITVDRYGDFLLIHLYTPSLLPFLENFIEALASVWKPEGIYLQKRFRSQTGEGIKEPSELVYGNRAPLEVEVLEGSLRFIVDVTAPLGTGFFPDFRAGRQAVAAQAHGKRVLNLFSYSGSISMYAAMGGAKEVVSIDLAAKAHARARKNLQLSGQPENVHELITGDVFPILDRMKERNRQFDLVILDPPPFSQAQGKPFRVHVDYPEIVLQALSVCAPYAFLYCCSNSLKFSRSEMETALGQAAAEAHRSLRIVEQVGLPPDFPVPVGFPEGNYLKIYGCVVE